MAKSALTAERVRSYVREDEKRFGYERAGSGHDGELGRALLAAWERERRYRRLLHKVEQVVCDAAVEEWTTGGGGPQQEALDWVQQALGIEAPPKDPCAS